MFDGCDSCFFLNLFEFTGLCCELSEVLVGFMQLYVIFLEFTCFC